MEASRDFAIGSLAMTQQILLSREHGLNTTIAVVAIKTHLSAPTPSVHLPVGSKPLALEGQAAGEGSARSDERTS